MRRTWIAALAVPMALAGFATPASAKDGKPPKTPPNEQFTITFDAGSPTAPGTVVATGPISGSGTATTSKHRHLGHARFDADVLTFSGGTVNVKDIRERGSRKVDSATCTATENSKGAFVIKRGTGAYANAKGRGKFTVEATVVGNHDATKPHGCDFKTMTGSIVITGSGHATV